MDEKISLCRRCEYRSKFYETDIAPRSECKDTAISVYNCYSYQPVKPLVIEQADKDDKRAVTLNYFSARVNPVGVSDNVELVGKKDNSGMMVYWRPKRVRKIKP